jgi:hypothetical protein
MGEREYEEPSPPVTRREVLSPIGRGRNEEPISFREETERKVPSPLRGEG